MDCDGTKLMTNTLHEKIAALEICSSKINKFYIHLIIMNLSILLHARSTKSFHVTLFKGERRDNIKKLVGVKL